MDSRLQSFNFTFLDIDPSPNIIIFSLHFLKQSLVDFTGARAIRHWAGKELDAIVRGRTAKWGGRILDDGDPDFPDIRVHDICSMSRAVYPAVNNMPIGLPVSHGNIFSVCSVLIICILNSLSGTFSGNWIDVRVIPVADHIVCSVFCGMGQLKIFSKWGEAQGCSVFVCELYNMRCV